MIDPLIQSSYLGGSAVDRANGVAVAATRDVYVAGETTSTDFPGTAGGLQATKAGNSDGFVALLNGALTSLIRVTYLGGTAFQADRDINTYLCVRVAHLHDFRLR